MLCRKDVDCKSGSCRDGICVPPTLDTTGNPVSVKGAPQTQCRSNNDCKVEEYCDRLSEKCIPKGGVGTSCRNSSTCLKPLFCYQGSCQKKCVSQADCGDGGFCDLEEKICKAGGKVDMPTSRRVAVRSSRESSGNSKLWIYVGMGVVVLLIVSFIIWFIFGRKKNGQSNSETISTSQKHPEIKPSPSAPSYQSNMVSTDSFDSQSSKFDDSVFCSAKYEERLLKAKQ